MADKKRVWVVGAGSSRSLGGPLLSNLLSDASYDQIARVYGDLSPFKDGADVLKWVYRLYHFGSKYKYGGIHAFDKATGGQDIWPDAEVFLDELDTATATPATATPANTLASKILGIADKLYDGSGPRIPSIVSLSAMARRLVAAECCAFLRDPGVTATERWQPYRDWVRSLGSGDTIVTFNYDLVVEMVTKGIDLHVILNEGTATEANDVGGPRLLKLHGSVDWKLEVTPNDDAVITRRDDAPEFALQCDDREICIATPGATKATTAKQLRFIWRAAENALLLADEIYFVGYRFPPTDAESRKRLLTAIHRNERPHLALHAVLGPQSTSRSTLSTW